ncbi:uncharacterized protein LOC115884778 [Sitophilus oryzae]|uniref:Uncharacterized protein LOC115884778 n=1 Tax=Sitophilus oryzae TaxID=7048 RepID=A0A6J2Y860_SITOR|nr:uncharacterized protein LOC115884778 [Sitophilus oryzae]
MVFVCPTKEISENITELSSKIKKTLKDVENSMKIGVKPICLPCCVPMYDYPSEIKNNGKEDNNKNNYNFDPPQVMVCYREPYQKSKESHNGSHKEEGVIRLKTSKSRELRASILYTGCLCEKRNGLQDDCPRTGCHGSPECLTSPPSCGPSEFCDGKHLGKKNSYRHTNGNGSSNNKSNGNSHNNGGNGKPKARYKCFTATVDSPVLCYPPRQPCPCPNASSQQ